MTRTDSAAGRARSRPPEHTTSPRTDARQAGWGPGSGLGSSALGLSPGRDAGVNVTTHVIGAGRSLRLAQLPVCGPRVVVDADHAAGGSLRRHADSVADSLLTRHLRHAKCVADVLRVTTHPEVLSKHAEGPADVKFSDLMGLVPNGHFKIRPHERASMSNGTPLPEHLSSSVSSTLQHIRLIQHKEARLAEARHDALAQVLHRIGAEYRTGRLTDSQLCAALKEIQGLEMSGRMNMWDEIVGVSWKRLNQLARQLPNGPEGSWVGEYPFHPGSVAPISGIAVVYVLFDESNEPCYVGSTGKFRSRMNSHNRDGKQFTRWQAHPCPDRAHAYRLEDHLLRRHKPYLNQKASR